MFGYVKPFYPDLRMREYEVYRAVYCGLCKAMGRVTGKSSRLLLNYDFTFLAVIRLLASENRYTISGKRCIVHPAKKKKMVDDCEELRYTALVSSYLTRGKIDDNIKDEKGFKKMCAVLGRPFVKKMVRKGDRRTDFGASYEEVESDLSRLGDLESGEKSSIDACAEAFGDLLGKIFSYDAPEPASRILYEIGCGVGKYIYLIDAADDLQSDSKSGKFNPIISFYGQEALKEENGEILLDSDVAEQLKNGVLLNLEKTAKAAELICDGGDKALAAITRNILYLGLPNILKEILKKTTSGKTGKKGSKDE